jgi:hypothetical protein
MTIFLAGAALGILQHLKADGLAEVLGPDKKGRLEQGEQIIIRRAQDVMALSAR